jgi:hypothetical protein
MSEDEEDVNLGDYEIVEDSDNNNSNIQDNTN